MPRWLVLVLHVLLLRIVLDVIYATLLVPRFGYMGHHVDIGLALPESYALTVLAAILIPPRLKEPSSFFLILLLVFTLLPMLSLFGLRGEDRSYVYCVLIAFALTRVALTLPLLSVPRPRGGAPLAVAISVALLLLLLGTAVAKGGLGNLVLNPKEVYLYRDRNIDLLFSGIFGYLAHLTTGLLTIFLMVHWLEGRRYFAVLGVLVAQFLLFALTTHKAVLLYPIMGFAVYFTVERRHFITLFVGGLLAIFLAAYVYWISSGDFYALSQLVLRVFFTPAHNHFLYHAYFLDKPLMLMAEKGFVFWLDYPYEAPVPNLISQFGYGTPTGFINTGAFATGFMHFGYVGVLVYGILLGVTARLVDSVSAGRVPLRYAAAIFAVPFWIVFRSADLTTALLTHGMLFGLLILWLASGSGRFRGSS